MNWHEGQWATGTWDSPSVPVPPPTAPPKKPKLNRRTMASNPNSDNSDLLGALADRMADG